MKILFLASDPSDATRLRIGQELRDIRERLQLSKLRDNFLLESRESVRPVDITQAIFDVEPQIVHFSGHGLNTGELCFEDALGKAKPIQPKALADLFELVARNVTCVVLNACYSKNQAKVISEHIPFVIGMNQAIGDRAAIAFTTGFYKALGSGCSFEEAYKFAIVEIQLENIPEHLTPVIYIKNQSISNSVIVQKTESNDLAFANIAIDSSDLNWKEMQTYRSYSPFKINCSHFFELDQYQHIYGASLSFDITIINLNNTPVILTAVGIEVVSAAHIVYASGMPTIPTAAKIYKQDSYEIELPDIKEWLSIRTREPITLNETISTRLRDPIYLEINAPYRYGLLLKEYQSRMPNYAILSLWILTNLGETRSKLVEISSG